MKTTLSGQCDARVSSDSPLTLHATHMSGGRQSITTWSSLKPPLTTLARRDAATIAFQKEAVERRKKLWIAAQQQQDIAIQPARSPVVLVKCWLWIRHLI
jgi:hypothetical protein